MGSRTRYQSIPIRVRALVAILVLPTTMMSAWPALVAAEESTAPVGTVSLVLGRAWVESPDGRRDEVRSGDEIRATDRITTSSTGHVHVRFVDDALVSVRPRSRLQVTEYVYDAEHPADSLVRFRLEEGVTRSISGEAGRNARERFRLDTPIAAIGVRGTDFVVSASQDNVRALVNEGAIVMAPYSDSCVSGGLGPCVDGGVELVGASMQMAELAQGDLQPVLRPRADEQASSLVQASLTAAGDEEEEPSSTDTNSLPEVHQEAVAIREVNERASESDNTDGAAPVVPTIPGRLDEAVLRERQLAWGRYSGSQDGASGITLAWADARDGREITVGDNRVGLYRREDGAGRLEASLSGAVGFRLDAAQAVHEGVAGVETMTVHDGSLNIDFTRSTFDTGLELESDATGAINFNASGQIFSDGVFYNRGDDGNIAGAVSLDGREAGYFFDRQLDSGLIRGGTLWGIDE